VIKNFIKNTRPFSWAYLIYHAERRLLNKKSNHIKTKSENDSIQYLRVKSWFKVNGDETLRLDYDLNESSVVFDVGGYKGEFARDIFCKYQPFIFLFEPLIEFYEIAEKRFCKNTKISTYNFGLSDHTCKTLIGKSDNASSTLAVGLERTEIDLVSILDFISDNKIKKIDLIKLNIEGGEYHLLESVIRDVNIKMFKNIQVQFHDFVIDNASERMKSIQYELSKTHYLTYQYEFVWENWRLKSEFDF
jgi:FkbM family methyltransferase